MDNTNLDSISRAIAAMQLRSISSVTSPNVNSAFQDFKQRLELRDGFDEHIQQKHRAIRSVLGAGGYRDTKLIGSLQRKTRIHPLPGQVFDVDILVILHEFTGWVSEGGITPSDAMTKLDGVVEQSRRYEAMNPQRDDPTIIIEHTGEIKIELVPAYLDNIGYSPDGTPHAPAGRAYWVSNGTCWELADYDYDADYITNQNTIGGGWLVPTVKMLKSLKRRYFPHMKSFHLEILAAQIIPKEIRVRQVMRATITYPALIRKFFEESTMLLAMPARIPWSHTPAISIDPTLFPTTLQKFIEINRYIVNIMQTTSDTKKIQMWRQLFGDPFPAN